MCVRVSMSLYVCEYVSLCEQCFFPEYNESTREFVFSEIITGTFLLSWALFGRLHGHFCSEVHVHFSLFTGTYSRFTGKKTLRVNMCLCVCVPVWECVCLGV